MPLSSSSSSITPLSYLICVLSQELYATDDFPELNKILLGTYLIKAKKISRKLYLFLYQFAFINEPNSISKFFSETTSSWIDRLGEPLDELQLVKQYNTLRDDFIALTNDVSFSEDTQFNYYIEGCVLACRELSLSEKDINNIVQKANALKRFPVAFALDCYINSLENPYKDFIINNTCAFLNSPCQVYDKNNLSLIVKVENLYRKYTNEIKKVLSSDDNRVYWDMSFEAINRAEDTHFSQSMISQMKYLVCNMKYIDDKEYFISKGIKDMNQVKPSWLYFPDCLGMQDMTDDEYLSAEDSLLIDLANQIQKYLDKPSDIMFDIQHYFLKQTKGPRLLIVNSKEKVDELESQRSYIWDIEDLSTMMYYRTIYPRRKSLPYIIWKYNYRKTSFYIFPSEWEPAHIDNNIYHKINELIKDLPNVQLVGTSVVFSTKPTHYMPYFKRLRHLKFWHIHMND